MLASRAQQKKARIGSTTIDNSVKSRRSGYIASTIDIDEEGKFELSPIFEDYIKSGQTYVATTVSTRPEGQESDGAADVGCADASNVPTAAHQAEGAAPAPAPATAGDAGTGAAWLEITDPKSGATLYANPKLLTSSRPDGVTITAVAAPSANSSASESDSRGDSQAMAALAMQRLSMRTKRILEMQERTSGLQRIPSDVPLQISDEKTRPSAALDVTEESSLTVPGHKTVAMTSGMYAGSLPPSLYTDPVGRAALFGSAEASAAEGESLNVTEIDGTPGVHHEKRLMPVHRILGFLFGLGCYSWPFALVGYALLLTAVCINIYLPIIEGDLVGYLDDNQEAVC